MRSMCVTHTWEPVLQGRRSAKVELPSEDRRGFQGMVAVDVVRCTECGARGFRRPTNLSRDGKPSRVVYTWDQAPALLSEL